MQVKEVLNDVEQQLEHLGVPSPDRLVLTQWLQQEVRTLVSKEDWDWAVVMLNPVIQVRSEVRTYPLPADFGTNFIRYTERDGSRYGCKLISNSNETFLDFESPAQFFTRNLSSTNTAVPAAYTITTLPNGRRQLHIDPLPDATYSVTGLYRATGLKLEGEDDTLPYPGDSPIGTSLLMKRIFKGKPLEETYSREVMDAMSDMRMELALARQARVIPVQGTSTTNTYRLFRNTR